MQWKPRNTPQTTVQRDGPELAGLPGAYPFRLLWTTYPEAGRCAEQVSIYASGFASTSAEAEKMAAAIVRHWPQFVADVTADCTAVLPPNATVIG